MVRNDDDRSSLAQPGHAWLKIGLYRAGRRTVLLNESTNLFWSGDCSRLSTPLLASHGSD